MCVCVCGGGGGGLFSFSLFGLVEEVIDSYTVNLGLILTLLTFNSNTVNF